jgi:competence protein ComEC
MRDLRLLPAAGATWLACALLIGGSPHALVATAALAAVAAGALVVPIARGGPRGGAAATACLALVAVVVVCVSCAAQMQQRGSGLLAELTADRATAVVVGVVRGEALPMVSGWSGEQPRFRTVLAVDHVTGRGRSGPAASGVLVLGGEAVRDLPYGARARLVGRLSPSEPGDEVSAVLVVAGEGVSVITPPGPIDRTVNRIRGALLDVTDGLPADARGLVPGAAIGDTTRLPADLDRAMRDVSLTHITAVSGAHFAVLTVAVVGLTALLRLPRRARAGATACVMAGFVLLVHPEPSVVRAGVMGAISVAGMVLGRPSRAVPSLGAAVVVLLVLDPWLARSFGFVLSVLATGSIALLGPPIAARLGMLPRWLAVAVAVPLAAQAVCAPVLVLLQPGVGLLAVPANVLAAPALVPATVLGVVGAVLAPWLPGLAWPVLQAAALATWWIAAVARTAAGLAGARADWPPGAGGAVALAVVTATGLALGLSMARWPRWLRRLGALIALLSLLIVLAVRVVTPRAVPLDWEVTLCDVGQGDMLVLRSGPSAGVVVDVGPDPSLADRCLDMLGVRRIDLLVLTHFHADHVGGLSGAMRGREVGQGVVSPLDRPAASAAAALAALAEAGIPVRVGAVGGAPLGSGPVPTRAGPPAAPVGSGVSGQVRWMVLSPVASVRAGAAEPSGSQVNDASVVLLLETPAVTVLALGDAETGAQGDVARRFAASGRVRVDVVKVAHHGSRAQSERLADLRPAFALIGVGRDNGYGHPAQETIRLYSGAIVLATHECGDVALSPVPGRAREVRVTAGCVQG